MLAAMGISEAAVLRLGSRYHAALAQTSSRKLALLVGINQYPQLPALTGCLTDVELQRELLIYRFGFQAQDVLVLTDEQATRQNIETAFVEHLVKQAKSDDAVIFHFSGYGSPVGVTGETPVPQDGVWSKPVGDERDLGDLGESSLATTYDHIRESKIQNLLQLPKIQNSLIPVDWLVSSKDTSEVNVFLEETLRLLWRSLATNRVTTVLDTSFADLSLWDFTLPMLGSVRVRSLSLPPGKQISPEELAFQAELDGQLNTNAIKKLLDKRERTPIGQILAAADANRIATEVQCNGFSAGLFTYALTQYLWQATSPTTVQVTMSRVASTLSLVVGNQQQPSLSSRQPQQPLLTYYLTPDGSTADGVVTGLEDNGTTALLWLGGLPLTVLDSFSVNSLLTSVPLPGSHQQIPRLQIRSREGLKAKARIVSTSTSDPYTLQVGQLVREAVRVLPRHIGLTVALDASLERIERVDATSAFSNIANVSAVIAGEQPADCFFGRVLKITPKTGEEATADAIATPQYGLFTPSRELISHTAGEPGEAIKTAVYRLIPKLQTRLATKLLRLSENEASSQLGVKATLEIVAPQQQVLMERVTQRYPMSDAVSKETGDGKIVAVAIGSQIQYRLHNYSDRPVYFMLLLTDSGASAIALYSQKTASGETKPTLKDEVILPGETITLPDTSSAFKWIVQGSPGLAETQLIFSQTPLTQTLATINTIDHPTERQRIGVLLNPVEVSRAVLQDLHSASITNTEGFGISSDTFALDVNAWATLSFVYEIV